MVTAASEALSAHGVYVTHITDLDQRFLTEDSCAKQSYQGEELYFHAPSDENAAAGRFPARENARVPGVSGCIELGSGPHVKDSLELQLTRKSDSSREASRRLDGELQGEANYVRVKGDRC